MEQRRLRGQLALAIVLGVTGIVAVGLLAWLRGNRIARRLRDRNERDALTGLHNRRYFEDAVIAIAGSEPMNGCVLMADLDHCNRVNDDFGYAAGDAVLKTVTTRLASSLPTLDSLVRWDGDKFLVVLDSVTAEHANVIAERLLQAIRTVPVEWEGRSMECTISIGYACFPMAGATDAITLASAIALVDKALGEAKERGRDRACLISAIHSVAESETTPILRSIELTDMGVAA